MGFFGIIHKFYYIFSYHLDCDSNQLSCNLQLRHYKQALLWKKNFMLMKNHLNGQVNWTPESNRSTCRYHIGHMQYCMREAYSTISIVPANLIYSLFTLHCESKSCHLYIIHFWVALVHIISLGHLHTLSCTLKGYSGFFFVDFHMLTIDSPRWY